MATKKKAESKQAQPEESVLKATAEAIGSALGTIAAKSGLVTAPKSTSAKVGKLVKKNKSRLPRKAKKKLAKASAAK